MQVKIKYFDTGSFVLPEDPTIELQNGGNLYRLVCAHEAIEYEEESDGYLVVWCGDCNKEFEPEEKEFQRIADSIIEYDDDLVVDELRDRQFLWGE